MDVFHAISFAAQLKKLSLQETTPQQTSIPSVLECCTTLVATAANANTPVETIDQDKTQATWNGDSCSFHPNASGAHHFNAACTNLLGSERTITDRTEVEQCQVMNT